ncbi:MAG: DUF4428 domain-containing protein [Parasporobacterium sp.]|nr:DUF4428 domain-containing protein [Parasporobacterium sp.]
MGLFDKKYCSICGNQIKLLGNRKLEDGNCCKDCASKLSPFFSERRHSTVESIKEQLAYREANKAEVEKFNVTRTIGDGTKVLVDEDQKKFLITSAGKWREANPDILAFSDVTGCETRIDESKSEETTKDKDGNTVSYRPPHYSYSYYFKVKVYVNNPYFDEIDFNLNTFSVTEKSVGPLIRHGSEYESYAKSLDEIKEIFSGIRENVRAQAEAAAAPKVPVKCPCCGATTLPDAKGCCEYCGSAL